MIEKAFFKEKSTKWSKWLSYAIVNFFLMVVVFYILLNTIAYDWTGSLYPEGTGFHLDFLGDNLIPFIPEMAIFYIYLFYSMVILSMVYFAFVDGEKGYALSWSLVIINAIAILVYIVFPVSTYWWRQDLFAIENLYKGNFFAEAMFGYYRSDTSFNCLPSLHAAVSVIIFYAWYRY
ncbi:MAG: phosphatase PAP2 family protein, partial [Promethearchaeota archaeon]